MTLRRPSFRGRITLGFVVAGVTISGLVAASTWLLARSYLTRQRTDVVLSHSFNTLRLATEHLNRVPAPSDEELVNHLALRSETDILLTKGPQSVASSVSISHEKLPQQLILSVERGRVAHQVFGSAPRRLAFGSPIPGSDKDLYLVYPLRELDATLATLARVLLGVSLLAAAISGLLGLRLGRRVVEPLTLASQASRRVALGLTDTRLDLSGEDELGTLSASFNEMARALQERIAREGRFVADASHELRTPLTSLRASLEYLVEHGRDLPTQFRATAELAAKQAGSLQRLAESLLELIQLESGAAQVRDEEVDLARFAAEVTRRRADGAAVQVSAPGNPVVVRTDKQRLERVVGNLVENAVVHAKGKEVELKVEPGERPTITISDRGPGIAAEELSHIFEPFWRGGQARAKSSGAGSGLGLAIARENASRLGASIEVHSAPSEGTTFSIRLPAEK